MDKGQPAPWIQMGIWNICRIAADSSRQNEEVAGQDTDLEAAPYDEKQSNN